MGLTIWSIGHSNHQFETFVALLTGQAIEMVIDVRSRPVSRWNPQFNRTALSEALKRIGIQYQHAPDLGGLHEGAGAGDPFEKGLDRLEQFAEGCRLAVMCSEGDPNNCHRSSMIGTAWRARTHHIIHILPTGDLAGHAPDDDVRHVQLNLF